MSNYSDSQFDEDNANTSWYKVYNLIPAGSVVLDVGCSSGNFGEILIDKKSCTVDGIEVFEEDYAKAKKKLRNTYKLDIERDSLDAIKDKYDLVYFGDVIEHLKDPVSALRRIRPLLKPGGKVLFSIPNMGHVAVRLLLLKGEFEYTETGLLDKTHLHFYTLDEVYRTFIEAGYEIDHMDFVEKDYPKELITEELADLGLKANKEFLEAMAKPEASAFQFVGTARASTSNKVLKRKQFGPIDLFEDFYTNKVDELESQINTLKNENTSLVDDATKWRELKKAPTRFVAKKLGGKLKR